MKKAQEQQKAARKRRDRGDDDEAVAPSSVTALVPAMSPEETQEAARVVAKGKIVRCGCCGKKSSESLFWSWYVFLFNNFRIHCVQCAVHHFTTLSTLHSTLHSLYLDLHVLLINVESI